MKLSLLSSLVALSSLVFAAEDANHAPEAEREIVTDPNFEATPEKPFNFKIDYSIAFKEDPEAGTIEDLINGETIELLYNFHSLEPAEVSIVGVGGELLDPVTGEVMANITASQIGPIPVLNNDVANFTQRVGINMETGKYLLVPAVYIVYQDQFMLLGSKNKIVHVVEPTISFFNPQLLLSELILGATVACIGYYFYVSYATKYLSGVLPESLLPAEKKKKTSKPSKTATSAKSTSAKSDFESWLPDSHKNLTKKQKKKL